jgi:hypothetical protein
MRDRSVLLKLTLLLLLPCLSLSVLAGCRSHQNRAAKQQPPLPFLLFQKTPCLGTCPSYEAAIATNGAVRFVGWEHVAVIDTVQFQLAPKEMEALRKEVEQLQYAELKTVYLTQWSDMPSTITTFYRDGKQEKRVKHQEGGPERLVRFQQHLHERLMKLVEEEANRLLPKE